MLHTSRACAAAIAGLVLAVGLSACTGKVAAPTATVGSLTHTEEVGDGQVRVTHVDVLVLQSVPELTKAASSVVIGRVVGTGTPQDMARDPLDPTRPAPDQKAMSQIYRVEIERWLKGSGPSKIEVAVSDYVERKDGTRWKEPYAQLEVGQRYALFLGKIDFYHGIAIPWQFLLKGGRAEAREGDEFREEIKSMAGLTEASLIRMVEAAVAQGR